MSTARLAAALASVAALVTLVGCTPRQPDPAPTAALPVTPLPVAPSLTPLAPGSPLAIVPTPPPTATATPTPTATPSSPLKNTVLGWTAYSWKQLDSGVQVSYARSPDRAQVISAGVYPASKSQAQIEQGMPGGKHYGKAWCVTDTTNKDLVTCVLKVTGNKAVLVVGPKDVPRADLGKITEALAAGL